MAGAVLHPAIVVGNSARKRHRPRGGRGLSEGLHSQPCQGPDGLLQKVWRPNEVQSFAQSSVSGERPYCAPSGLWSPLPVCPPPLIDHHQINLPKKQTNKQKK